MAIEIGDQVRFEYTGRLTDGTVFDTSRESVAEEAGLADDHPDREFAPLTVEIGAGRIIEGLEDGLVGLEEGDVETITVSPDEAYGESSDDQVMTYEPSVFRQMLEGEDPEVGMHVQTQQGEIGEVVHIDSDVIRVDFNHELAGETLEFEIEILDIEA